MVLYALQTHMGNLWVKPLKVSDAENQHETMIKNSVI